MASGTERTDAPASPEPARPPAWSPQPVVGPVPAGGPLTSTEREILRFERHWWRYAGAKEQAIRDAFAMTPTRYYQVVNSLLDRPEALAEDPMLVKRLRRMRSGRRVRADVPLERDA